MEKARKKGWMRDKMPETAAFIDKMREAFGEIEVNQVIKRGMKGEPVFYAEENGHRIGTYDQPNPDKCLYIGKDGILITKAEWEAERGTH